MDKVNPGRPRKDRKSKKKHPLDERTTLNAWQKTDGLAPHKTENSGNSWRRFLSRSGTEMADYDDDDVLYLTSTLIEIFSIDDIKD